MFDQDESNEPSSVPSEILSTLLTRLRKIGKNIVNDAKDVHLKQTGRTIMKFIDVADAFRVTNANTMKNGKRTPEDTQNLVKIISNMKSSLKQCQSNFHAIQTDLSTGMHEHQEVMNLRAENVRLKFKEIQGGPTHSLRNLCNEQKRALMNLEDENRNLRKALRLSKLRQSNELKELKDKVAPLDEKMRRWQHDLADMKELSSVNMKHTIDRLKFDLVEMNEKFQKFKLHHDEELTEARKASTNIKQAWHMHERRTKRLQIAYDSIMPYLYGQGIQVDLNYQKEHMTLAQGIDCLRVELDEMDKRYTLVTQQLETTRAECHVLREKYMKKVLDGKKKDSKSEIISKLRHVVASNEEQLSMLKKRHRDEIQRIKKDHEMELTYQLRNSATPTLKNRHMEEIQRMKKDLEMELTYQVQKNINVRQLEIDLRNALDEITLLKQQQKTGSNKMHKEVNPILQTPTNNPSENKNFQPSKRSNRKAPPIPVQVPNIGVQQKNMKETTPQNAESRVVKEVPRKK